MQLLQVKYIYGGVFKRTYIYILFIKYDNTFLQNMTQSNNTNMFLKNTTGKRANKLILAQRPPEKINVDILVLTDYKLTHFRSKNEGQ